MYYCIKDFIQLAEYVCMVQDLVGFSLHLDI